MRTDETRHDAPEAAIARVLQAERDAGAAVGRCKAECAAQVVDARKRAGEIAARAERRITALNRKIGAEVDRRILALDAASPADAGDGAIGEEDAILSRAAAALARELTGAGS